MKDVLIDDVWKWNLDASNVAMNVGYQQAWNFHIF